MLELGALELAGEVVARLRVRHGVLGHVGLLMRWSRLVGGGFVRFEEGRERVGDLVGAVFDEEVARVQAATGHHACPGAPDLEDVAVEPWQGTARAPEGEQRALDPSGAEVGVVVVAVDAGTGRQDGRP